MLRTLPSRLLQLSPRDRLGLVFWALVMSLAFYELRLPTTLLAVVLILPLMCTTWLFGWWVGLLCLAGVTLTLGASYGVAFWSSPWLVLTWGLHGLVVYLMVGGLRHRTRALQDVRRAMANVEEAYHREHLAVEHMLQNLRHELRTPIAQIQGYLELLEIYRDKCDSATQANFIENAQMGCDELLHVVEATLTTTQAPEGQQTLLSSFPLKNEIQAVLASFGPQFLRDHQVKLKIADALQVYAEPHLLRQVVRNLLTNINKYTPASTEVTVSATSMRPSDGSHEKADMICVRVEDRGPGIPPDQLSLLFQRHMRLPQARESSQPGSGLGLAICKQLVEAMGGSIWAESTGKAGEGCCFSFTLACQSAPGVVEKHEGASQTRLYGDQSLTSFQCL